MKSRDVTGNGDAIRAPRKAPEFGALVISLDFAIHWGVRYRYPANGAYAASLVGVRRVVPEMLRLFEEFDVASTWATVGFLFARSRAELRQFSPAVRPSYLDPTLSPYEEEVGQGEDDDPLHYAPSLIAAIRDTPRQEIGTHTFSHYYCQEPGQDREQFRADLASAVTIATQHGVQLRSIVFPRNQYNPEYDDVLWSTGIRCFRGNTPGWMYAATLLKDGKGPLMRGGRLLNAYVPLSGIRTSRWDTIVQPNGLCNLPASLFLKPYSPRLRQLESLRIQRVAGLIRHAATSREIVHLYCHPHNFGGHLAGNMSTLRAVLDTFARYRASHGMQSLSMGGVAEIAESLASQDAYRAAFSVER
jgi:peptidoglycan/xylan/chitin deacetylase (PgdA/CDA1 family)